MNRNSCYSRRRLIIVHPLRVEQVREPQKRARTVRVRLPHPLQPLAHVLGASHGGGGGGRGRREQRREDLGDRCHLLLENLFFAKVLGSLERKREVFLQG